MKVLIVEDNQDLCDIYSFYFQKRGWDVVVKNDGLNAIAQVADINPDLIVLDLMIPELDGFGFLDAVQNNTSLDFCVIVASNLSSDADIQRAKKLGAYGYLQKSDYTGTELVEKVLGIFTEFRDTHPSK